MSRQRMARGKWVAVAVCVAALFSPVLVDRAMAQACNQTFTADVVALDQPFFYNRLGAFNANGMMYALRRDVVDKVSGLPESAGGVLSPGNVMLRPDKRPRPLVLRMNAGSCLEINFTNLLNPIPIVVNVPGVGEVDDQPITREASIHVNGMQLVGSIASDGSNVGRNPSSLAAPGQSKTYKFFAEYENTYLLYSMGATVGGEGGAGTITFGLFGAVNVEPAGSEWYRSQLSREEMDLATVKNPDGSPKLTAQGHPVLNYDAVYPNGTGTNDFYVKEGKVGLPILKMTQGSEIVHSDINAVITGPARGNFRAGTHYRSTAVNPDQEKPFREFTIIFHDEVFAVQSFAGFFGDPVLLHTLAGVRDTFAINYGTGGIGAEIIANRLGVGPMWDCNDCEYEEFFLTSWAVGDPGMIVDVPANAGLEILGPGTPPAPGTVGPKATKAFYPEDPAGVHHSYISDRVKMRNLHAGPKEQHMFHLHSHQWVFSPQNDNSSYLDGQTIGAGSGYTYDIANGGSGNRNKTPGDAIFHCHFYPHFAQGMWELWRNHDVFEQGTQLQAKANPFDMNAPVVGARALPDGEIELGTPIPGVVPIPTLPMAPMPALVTLVGGSTLIPPLPGSQVSVTVSDPPTAKDNPGYPFNIAAVAGHRPPTPPLDLIDDGGLPRHVFTGPLGANLDPAQTFHVESRLDFSKFLTKASALEYPEDGTPAEKAAMLFHEVKFHETFFPDGTPATDVNGFRTNGQSRRPGAPYAEPCLDDNGNLVNPSINPFFRGETAATPQNVQFGADNPRIYKAANIQLDMIFNKVGYHHPQQRIISLWEDVGPTLAGDRPPEPFVMRLNTLDCAEFHHTNLVPSIYELDDYQVRTPTDVIGQHIHMVKFDVTASDGAANGFNYEDGTLSPDEVRERIKAINADGGIVNLQGGKSILTPEPHPFFSNLPNADDRWIGARTTVQRWFADPVLNNKGEDRTLGVVFTHDHFGPSSHQQVGLYGTLLIEPAGSRWVHNETGDELGTRESDGGPTSWQAAIIGGNNPIDGPSYREFFFEWSDFQHAYKKDFDGVTDTDSFRKAINPVVRVEAPGATANDPGDVLQFAEVCPGGAPRPCPEAINAKGHTMYVTNYRNEPVGLRVFDPAKAPRLPGGIPGGQAAGLAGDLAFAFSSDPAIQRVIPELNALMPAAVRATTFAEPNPANFGKTITIGTPLPSPQLTADVLPGDPATPTMRVYQGDRVRIKLQTGATEEAHNITIHGMKWLQEYANINSGWRNSHQMGIDEQFQLRTPIIADKDQVPNEGNVADYLYTMNAGSSGYWSGVWGFLRSYGEQRDDLYPLPGTDGKPFIENLADFDNDRLFAGVCPRTAPRRRVDVTAVQAKDVLATTVNAPGGPINTLIYNARPDVVPDFTPPPDPDGGGNRLEGGAGPLHNPTALMYVRTSDLDPRTGKLRTGTPIEPLILRARAGECIEVTLRNKLPVEIRDLPGWHIMPGIIDKSESPKVTFNMNDLRPSSHVGLHAQLLEYDITRSDGTNVGRNPVQTAPPGGIVQYRWYAGDIRLQRTVGNRFRLIATPVEFGGLNLMPADRIEQGGKGLVGGMVVLPRNGTFTEDNASRASATVRGTGLPRTGARDFVAVLQNETQLYYANTNNPVPMVGGAEGRFAEDMSEDSGQKGINYRIEPAWFRLGFPPHTPLGLIHRNFRQDKLFSNQEVGADPQTPIFQARKGFGTRFHFMVPDGTSRFGVLALHGHLWQREPYNGNAAIGGPTGIASNPTSQKIGSQEGLGPSSHYDIVLEHGAGGAFSVPGDYLYRMEDGFKNLDGQWGIFRVE